MLKARYEEYTLFDDELPFRLSVGLERTALNFSREPNWHDNLEIQFCSEGKGELLLDGRRYLFVPGEIAVVNSQVIHQVIPQERIQYICLIVDTQFCRRLNMDPSSLLFECRIRSGSLAELFHRIEAVYRDTSDVCRVAKLTALVLNILIELREKHVLQVSRRPVRDSSFETVRLAIQYIRENYSKKMSLDEIAKHVLTDKYTLSRQFRGITGSTVVGYINSCRCSRAAEYILRGSTVTEAALLCGFNNMSFFARTFRQCMGILPSKYKKGVRGFQN